MSALAKQRAALSPKVTFRGNLRSTRHGWLRLTPAYSVELVRELLERRSHPDLPVLDPFCGTGTTLLTCAERGIACQTVDINPFLRWLATAKSRPYTPADLQKAERLVQAMIEAANRGRERAWVPPLYRIEKWWDEATLSALSRAFAELAGRRGKARDLAALAFCRTLIDVGNISFRHQSMSFRARGAGPDVGVALEAAFRVLASGATQPVVPGDYEVLLGDARELDAILSPSSCGCVITSPPYANRMSYIRELRPYMYWLGFLDDGRQAGELDWRAIGGTWGSATSQLMSWEPGVALELPALLPLVKKIARQSPLLARYVERYFCDMDQHLQALSKVLAPGGDAHYVIGNSKFFDVVVPAERLLASLLERHRFVSTQVRVLRRRTSKKQLFEYVVSAKRSKR